MCMSAQWAICLLVDHLAAIRHAVVIRQNQTRCMMRTKSSVVVAAAIASLGLLSTTAALAAQEDSEQRGSDAGDP